MTKEEKLAKNVIQLVLLVLIYIGINAASVFLPIMPGTGTMIAWGFVFPVCLIGVSWYFAFELRSDRTGRIVSGASLTLLSVSLGMLSYWLIGSMWATV